MSVITKDIVQQLVKIGRLCVVESGKVYDVTDFAERHPGGAEKIECNAGKDVSQILKDVKSHKHSSAAYSMLRDYYIGEYELGANSSKIIKNGGVTCNGSVAHNGSVKHNGSVTHNGTEAINNNGKAGLYEDQMIDWSKPLMWQVAGLKENYFDWVHRPVDRQIRLFKSDLVEYFSMCSWYVVPLVWIPVAIFLTCLSYEKLSQDPVQWIIPFTEYTMHINHLHMPVLIILGALCWTFAEYIIHRWLFHLQPPANIPLLIQFHFLMHGQHHKTPMDKRRLVFPPVPASGLALTIYLLYLSVLVPGIADAVMAGTTLGYLLYDLTHYYLHHGTPATNYFKNLKRYHVIHHYVDQQNGFGISSKLWDYPFGTLLKEKED